MKKSWMVNAAICWTVFAMLALAAFYTRPEPPAPLGLIQQIAAAKHTAAERSDKWPALRKHHLAKEPCCQWCGRTMNLQVHHIRPFHLHPELELDPDNLITLCETPGLDCHLQHGHEGNFHDGYNLDIRAQCDANEAALRAQGKWPQGP